MIGLDNTNGKNEWRGVSAKVKSPGTFSCFPGVGEELCRCGRIPSIAACDSAGVSGRLGIKRRHASQSTARGWKHAAAWKAGSPGYLLGPAAHAAHSRQVFFKSWANKKGVVTCSSR